MLCSCAVFVALSSAFTGISWEFHARTIVHSQHPFLRISLCSAFATALTPADVFFPLPESFRRGVADHTFLLSARPALPACRARRRRRGRLRLVGHRILRKAPRISDTRVGASPVAPGLPFSESFGLCSLSGSLFREASDRGKPHTHLPAELQGSDKIIIANAESLSSGKDYLEGLLEILFDNVDT